MTEQVLRHVLDGGEIGRSVFGANPALVIAEEHVHDPMQAVLDRPMAAHDRSEEVCQHDQGGDVEACLLLGFSSNLAAAFDHDDGVQAGPVVACLQPFDVMDDGGGSGFDAAVVAIDRRILADPGVGKVPGLLLGGKHRDIRAQRAWLPFRARTSSAFWSMTVLAISRWQPMASIVTIAPSIASMARSFGIAMISLDFSQPSLGPAQDADGPQRPTPCGSRPGRCACCRTGARSCHQWQ